jgi:co-chaperonin GroES (HSP10)
MSQPYAANDYVWVIRDETETEKDGLEIPDSAQVETNRGKIFSVGSLVRDRKFIQKDKTAIWNKHAGFEIEEGGVKYTILKENEIIGLQN